MGPKIVGQWNFKRDQLYVTAPKCDEDTSPLDAPSLAREPEMVSVYIENARRRRVKKIMERAQNINPKQPGHYRYSQRVGLKDKAPYSGQVVGTLCSLILHLLTQKCSHICFFSCHFTSKFVYRRFSLISFHYYYMNSH